MGGSPQVFGLKLTEAIKLIHAKTGLKLTDIEIEIGQELGYNGRDTIEKWKRGKALPKSPKLEDKVEKLTRLLVDPKSVSDDLLIEPTGLDRNWFNAFLKSSGYRRQDIKGLLDELFPSTPLVREHVPAKLLVVNPEEPPLGSGPLVGREKDLAILQALLKLHHMAAVTGMPGIGKTSLVGTLVQRTKRPSERLFWYTLRGQEGLDDIIYRLANFLAYYGEPTFLRLLQQRYTQPDNVLLDQILLTLSGKGYLLCLDDFHRLDDVLINQVLKPLQNGAKRGDFDLLIISRQTLRGGYDMNALTVDGLDEMDVAQVMRQFNLSPSDETLATLHQLTQGNPQLLILAATILDPKRSLGGLISRIVRTVDVEDFMMAEVDENLNDQERAVMQALAICMGYPATYQLLEEIADRGNLRKPLKSLRSRHLILDQDDGERYSQHSIVQQFYYDLVGKTERQAMHARAARYYSTTERDRLKAALHYEKAGKFQKSAEQLIDDNTAAVIEQGQAVAAGNLLDSLRKHLSQDVDIQSHVYQSLGTFYRIQGAYESAIDIFATACEQAHSPQRQIEFLYEILRVHRSRSTFDQALEISEKIMTLYEQNPMMLVEPKVLNGIGWIYNRLGNVEKAAHYFYQAWGEDGSTLTPDTAADVLLGIGAVAYHEKDFALAEAHFLDSQERFKALGNLIGQTQSLSNLGVVYQEQQKGDEALDCLEDVLKIFESIGDINSVIIGHYNIAITYILQEQQPSAESYLLEALPLAERVGNHQMLCRLETNLVQVALHQGRLDVAKTHLAEAERHRLEGGQNAEQGILYYISGAVALAQEQHQEALHLVNQAIPLLEQTHETDYLPSAQRVQQQALSGLQ